MSTELKKVKILNADQIMDGITLLDIVEHEKLKIIPAGNSRYVQCPNCGVDPVEKKRKGLSISVAKDFGKCFQCNWSVNAKTFYQKLPQPLTYYETLEKIANIRGIEVEYSKSKTEKITVPATVEKVKKIQKGYNSNFRDQQLAESGLKIEDVTSKERIDEKTTADKIRYTSGSKDEAGNIVVGNDMVLHYLGLDRKPITFYRKNKKGEAIGKPMVYTRIRHQFPEAHVDKYGKPVKYASPHGSGIHLWYPELLLKKFEKSSAVDTLFIIEGEKKADWMAVNGMVTVGIGGIHNLAQNGTLHSDFAIIVNALSVKNVVFVTDSDWDTIKAKDKEPINLRTSSFLSAVINFEAYFRGLKNLGIDLTLYFAYVKTVADKPEIKGIDDLGLYVEDGKKVKSDFTHAMNEKTGAGEYVNCVQITGWNRAKFSEMFHLQSVDSFIKHHAEYLKTVESFFYGRTEYKWDSENDKFIVAQPIEFSEMFWEKKPTKHNSDSFEFLPHKFDVFCVNRGIGKMTLQIKPKPIFQWVHAENKTKTTRIIDGIFIRDFVRDILHEMQEYEVSNYIRNNSKIKDDKLEQLPFIDNDVKMLEHQKPTAYLFFKQLFWIINAKEVIQRTPAEIEGYIWETQVIDAKPELLEKPLFLLSNEITQQENDLPDIVRWIPEYNEVAKNCQFLQFMYNTSKLIQKDFTTYTEQEIHDTNQNFANKITGFGYLLHRYFDPAVAKGVVAIDSIRADQEDNQGMGRSGKSLIGRALKEMANVMEIDGKSPDFDNDKFLFGRINEETDIVFIDDLGRKANMERFYNPIVGNLIVREMHKQDRPISRKDTPKFYITTNFDIYGMLKSDSTADRIFIMIFGSYYNKDFRPSDEFGQLFFDDWEPAQWNLFYNFCACCLQAYLQHGLIKATDQDIQKKLLFHSIHASVKNWAEEYFYIYDDKGDLILDKFLHPANSQEKYKHDKTVLFEDFMKHAHKENPRFNMSTRVFKDNFIAWCKYKGLVFNPGRQKVLKKNTSPDGGDWKTNGIEYFVVGFSGSKSTDMPLIDAENTVDLPF